MQGANSSMYEDEDLINVDTLEKEDSMAQLSYENVKPRKIVFKGQKRK